MTLQGELLCSLPQRPGFAALLVSRLPSSLPAKCGALVDVSLHRECLGKTEVKTNRRVFQYVHSVRVYVTLISYHVEPAPLAQEYPRRTHLAMAPQHSIGPHRPF